MENQPQKQPMSTAAIVLIVIAVILGLGIVTCGTCGFLAVRGAKQFVAQLGDGGALMLNSPPQVKAALATDKQDLVGEWHSVRGSSLYIDADGSLAWDKNEGTHTSKFTAPISGFSGNDIEIKMFVKLVLHIQTPPHRVADHSEMTFEGVLLKKGAP